MLPSSVTTIAEEAFWANSSIKEIIIKRTEEDAIANITFGNKWNDGYLTVIYDPNYTE